MALDFQQVLITIKKIAGREKHYLESIKSRRLEALSLLDTYAKENNFLNQKIEKIVSQFDPNVRCASPVIEDLNSHITAPEIRSSPTIIGVDGSQIIPNRHDAIFYGLVNIGAIVFKPYLNQAPEIYTESELLFGEDVRSRDGYLLSEGAISLKRDSQERKMLKEYAHRAQKPVIALTDGPVELWGAKDPSSASSYHNHLKQYLDDLEALQNSQVIFSGYVDKPWADLVVRLLEIADMPDGKLSQIRSFHPLRGVSDHWIFGKILGSGERSAIFSLQSGSRKDYLNRNEQITTHFFYINVGGKTAPAIARVEIPKWVADNSEQIELLHAILLQQSRVLGTKPYPYVLHRAHEIAKVSHDERRQVEMILRMELSNAQIEFGEESNKQFIKNLPEGKTRYAQ